ncbi:hypothetical protein PVAP13_9KG106380 [Panicum virgatum]|uniref:Transmembrane protein n=1 Tax=Panicum virgatum TaxID=38727 RepID=A0A8T0NF56_PANVG|nr:hypothetical protein PVAP13_9KG104300 [Panicum virgatum]KAG2547500.1 hypothetical protein PVAP13_9KG105340 [Panicum virgatum]KAG2547502.1 hypothetical protein PVAP13_9KG106380 [Panicum virgatum]
MASVASSRTISATVFLALIVTGWCLASAVPVAANARRLQQISVSVTVGQLTGQLQALVSGVQKLSDEVKSLLGAVLLPADLLGQLQQVADSCAQAQAQLQTDVVSLLLVVQVQPEIVPVVEDLLIQLATELETVLAQIQNALPVGGCFKDLQAGLVGAIGVLTDKLKSCAASLPASVQPVALIADLGNLGNAVSLVDACAPGLQTLLSNDQDVVLAVQQLIAGIRGSY